MYKQLALILVAILVGLVIYYKVYQAPLRAGSLAPDFRLKDENGTEQTLSQYRGKKVALYFYPKAATPGCTAEACSLRDGTPALKRNNIAVLGVSYDSPEQLKEFKEKNNLTFPLLSDSTKEVSKLYGTYQPQFPFVPARVTFLIDEQGKIVKVLENITVATHALDIMDAWGIAKVDQQP